MGVQYSPQADDLTDLASVELFLQAAGQGFPPGNVDEQKLQMFISAASPTILNYLGRKLRYIAPSDWAATTAYVNGNLVVPTSPTANPGQYTYRCSKAGISAASEPALFPQAVGQTLIDNGVIWTNVGLLVNTSETRDGNSQTRMVLRNYPVFSFGSCEVNGVYQTGVIDDVTDGVGISITGLNQRGELYVRGTPSWAYSGISLLPRGHQNLRINYGFGYWTPGQALLAGTTGSDGSVTPAAPPAGVPALPLDIKEACTELVALRYRQSRRWGDTATGEGPQRITYFVKEMQDATQMALNRYRDVVPWN